MVLLCEIINESSMDWPDKEIRGSDSLAQILGTDVKPPPIKFDGALRFTNYSYNIHIP